MDPKNSSFGPAPLQTPLTAQGPDDETGVPFQSRRAQGGVPSSSINPAWGAWWAHIHDKPGDFLPTPSISGTPLANTSQLLSEFMGGILNVRMFGAQGDGATDDTAAFMAAIAAAKTPVAGFACGVYVPAGNYVITSTLLVFGFIGFRLYGDGFASQITWAGGVTGPMFSFAASYRTRVSDILFKATSAHPLDPFIQIRSLNTGEVGAQTSQQLVMRRCWIDADGGGCTTALYIGGGLDQNNDYHCFKQVLITGFTGQGVRIQGSQAFTQVFTDCLVNSNGGNAPYGVYAGSESYALWGIPKVSVNAIIGDVVLHLTGLGSGTIPNASFITYKEINYQTVGAVVIVAGAAILTLTAGLAAAAPAGSYVHGFNLVNNGIGNFEFHGGGIGLCTYFDFFIRGFCAQPYKISQIDSETLGALLGTAGTAIAKILIENCRWAKDGASADTRSDFIRAGGQITIRDSFFQNASAGSAGQMTIFYIFPSNSQPALNIFETFITTAQQTWATFLTGPALSANYVTARNAEWQDPGTGATNYFPNEVVTSGGVGPFTTFPANLTSQDVSANTLFLTANTVATVIDHLLGGVDGKVIRVAIRDTFTSFTNTGNIQFTDPATFACNFTDDYEFVFFAGVANLIRSPERINGTFTGTAVLAKITGVGANGSLTFVNGKATAYVAPT